MSYFVHTTGEVMPGREYDRVLDTAADQHGYITTEQARTLGIQADTIRKMAARGALERVSWGVYRVPTFPQSPFAQYMEACLWPAGAMGVISHESALAIRELSDVNPSKVHLTVPKHFRVRREIPRHLVVHNADLADEELASVEGVPTTTVRRAIEGCHRQHLGPALLRQAIEEGQRQGYLRADDAQKLRELVLG
jgi:predicted transcriptional regulator of viral defense system